MTSTSTGAGQVSDVSSAILAGGITLKYKDGLFQVDRQNLAVVLFVWSEGHFVLFVVLCWWASFLHGLKTWKIS